MDEVDHRLSHLFHTLGNGIRLELLLKLQAASCTVTELAEHVDRPINAVSRHLRILRDNDLVESRSHVRHNVYQIKRPELVDRCLSIRTLLKR